MATKQSSLFEYFKAPSCKKRYGRTSHGGTKTQGYRKLERPLSTKRWIHLVLKSDKAKGELSFLSAKNRLFIERLITQKAKRFGIRVADRANVGNHLHLKIKISSRENFQKFLKSITTQIARFVTGARRGVRFGKFLARPRVHSRSFIGKRKFDSKWVLYGEPRRGRGRKTRSGYFSFEFL